MLKFVICTGGGVSSVKTFKKKNRNFMVKDGRGFFLQQGFFGIRGEDLLFVSGKKTGQGRVILQNTAVSWF